MGNRWDKMQDDATNALARTEARAKEVTANAEEAAAGGVHSVGDVLQDGVNVTRQTEQTAQAEAEAHAKDIEAHAATVDGAIKVALLNFAAKLRSGEEKLVAEVKAELEEIGVKFNS